MFGTCLSSILGVSPLLKEGPFKSKQGSIDFRVSNNNKGQGIYFENYIMYSYIIWFIWFLMYIYIGYTVIQFYRWILRSNMATKNKHLKFFPVFRATMKLHLLWLLLGIALISARKCTTLDLQFYCILANTQEALESNLNHFPGCLLYL